MIKDKKIKLIRRLASSNNTCSALFCFCLQFLIGHFGGQHGQSFKGFCCLKRSFCMGFTPRHYYQSRKNIILILHYLRDNGKLNTSRPYTKKAKGYINSLYFIVCPCFINASFWTVSRSSITFTSCTISLRLLMSQSFMLSWFALFINIMPWTLQTFQTWQ